MNDEEYEISTAVLTEQLTILSKMCVATIRETILGIGYKEEAFDEMNQADFYNVIKEELDGRDDYSDMEFIFCPMCGKKMELREK